MTQAIVPEPHEREEFTREEVSHGLDQGMHEELYRERVVHDVAAERGQHLVRISRFIWLFVGIVDGLVGLRVLLRLLGANPANPFADLVYALSGLFVAPFRTLLNNPASDSFVLEVTSLIAMLVYALVAWAMIRVIWIAFDRPSARSVSVYERDRRSDRA